MLLAVSIAIMACIFLVFAMIFINIKSNPLFVAIIPQKMVELLFYAFFVVLLLSNTVAAIGAMYSAKNMELLLYTPVSSLRLYLAKVGEMLGESSFMLIVFTLPTALAFYYSLDISGEFLIALSFLSIPFLLTPIGFAVLFATAFVRFSAVFWKRGAFFIGLVFCILVFVLFKTNSLLSEIDFNRGGTRAILQAVSYTHLTLPTICSV